MLALDGAALIEMGADIPGLPFPILQLLVADAWLLQSHIQRSHDLLPHGDRHKCYCFRFHTGEHGIEQR